MPSVPNIIYLHFGCDRLRMKYNKSPFFIHELFMNKIKNDIRNKTAVIRLLSTIYLGLIMFKSYRHYKVQAVILSIRSFDCVRLAIILWTKVQNNKANNGEITLLYSMWFIQIVNNTRLLMMCTISSMIIFLGDWSAHDSIQQSSSCVPSPMNT